MELTQILEWLLAWGLFLLAQSIFINGIYQAATGETKKRVDGSDEDSEMILYWLKKFFEQLDKTFIVYKGIELKKLIHEMFYQGFNDVYSNYSITDDGIIAHSTSGIEWMKINSEILEKRHFILIREMHGKHQFIKIYEDYKYSKWIRKPIIQCIKCMASFWGGLTYWPVVLFLFGFNWLEVPVFFADMFCLTYLNWVLYLKAQTK